MKNYEHTVTLGKCNGRCCTYLVILCDQKHHFYLLIYQFRFTHLQNSDLKIVSLDILYSSYGMFLLLFLNYSITLFINLDFIEKQLK